MELDANEGTQTQSPDRCIRVPHLENGYTILKGDSVGRLSAQQLYKQSHHSGYGTF